MTYPNEKTESSSRKLSLNTIQIRCHRSSTALSFFFFFFFFFCISQGSSDLTLSYVKREGTLVSK